MRVLNQGSLNRRSSELRPRRIHAPAAAKQKHIYGYSSNIYGYRIGSPRWWAAMDRAGRGGRPGGF
jgi:hypothetical protein